MEPGQDGNPRVSFKTFRGFFVFIAIFTIILGGALYYVMGSGARQALTEQMHLRMDAISKSGAQAISSFIRLYGNSLVLLADNQEIKTASKGSQAVLDDFVDRWKDTPINGVLVVDKNGTPRYISTKTGGETSSKNPSVADRDYFIWAKSAAKGEVFVGEPIFPRLGNLGNQYILTVATPIINNGEFNGVLVSAIVLSQLTDSYLSPLKTSPNTRVYLIDSSGTILYAPFEHLIGKNYIKHLEKKPFLGSDIAVSFLKKKAESKESGRFDMALPDEKKGGLTHFLICHNPVFYDDDRHFVLAIAIPAEEALAVIAPIYVNQLGLLLVAFLSLLLLTIVFIKFMEKRHLRKTEQIHSDD